MQQSASTFKIEHLNREVLVLCWPLMARSDAPPNYEHSSNPLMCEKHTRPQPADRTSSSLTYRTFRALHKIPTSLEINPSKSIDVL